MSNFVNLLDIIYPVGSVCISFNSSFSPSSTIGGTWTMIKDTFLWFTSITKNIGNTGGEQDHTLSVNEMPSHNHDIGWYCYDKGGWSSSSASGANPVAESNAYTCLANGPKTMTYTGGGASHNNMPPYLECIAYRRIA